MNEIDARLHCLELAEARYGSVASEDVIEAARRYADFVLGTHSNARMQALVEVTADLNRTLTAGRGAPHYCGPRAAKPGT